MLHASNDTANREQRAAADARDVTPGISDEELSVALRAAGASAEDVKRYLASNVTPSTDKGGR
jgi:hypothetical protein